MGATAREPWSTGSQLWLETYAILRSSSEPGVPAAIIATGFQSGCSELTAKSSGQSLHVFSGSEGLAAVYLYFATVYSDGGEGGMFGMAR